MKRVLTSAGLGLAILAAVSASLSALTAIVILLPWGTWVLAALVVLAWGFILGESVRD
jgi:hypothetical protein